MFYVIIYIIVFLLLYSYFFQHVKFAKCQAEELPEVSSRFAISAVPTFVILHSGKLIDRVDGANPTDLSKKVKAHVSIFVCLFHGFRLVS